MKLKEGHKDEKQKDSEKSDEEKNSKIRICGWNKTTLLDYPGHVAATVFVGGCNFRCPFCHNAGLVTGEDAGEVIEESEIFSFLERRRGILEGICITGGEPTLQAGLEDFVRRVKDLGYLVKLDTNGYRPDVLWNLLDQGLLDYVAMDIKNSRKHYGMAAGLEKLDLANVEESAAILMGGGTEYEFRTTVVKGIHERDDFEDIGRWLGGCQRYFLQSYRDAAADSNVLTTSELEPPRLDMRYQDEAAQGFEAFEKGEMEDFAAIARKYIDKVDLRGVE